MLVRPVKTPPMTIFLDDDVTKARTSGKVWRWCAGGWVLSRHADDACIDDGNSLVAKNATAPAADAQNCRTHSKASTRSSPSTSFAHQREEIAEIKAKAIEEGLSVNDVELLSACILARRRGCQSGRQAVSGVRSTPQRQRN